MSEPYVGQILTFAGNFAPRNYMLCAGQLLPISQYDVLYNLIGTIYGGDGVQTFALPDLRSRVPIHMGQGLGLSVYVQGQRSGVENVTLLTNNLPSHSHQLNIVSGAASAATPTGSSYLATEVQSNTSSTAFAYLPYSASNQQVPLSGSSISMTGQSLPHNNIQPVVALTYCIAVYGIYPTQG